MSVRVTTLAYVRTEHGVDELNAGDPMPDDVLPEELQRLTDGGVLEQHAPVVVPTPPPKRGGAPGRELSVVDEPTYADLNEMLAAYVEHREVLALVGGSDLTGLALEVPLQMISSLLLARAPDVLDPGKPDRFMLFLEALSGAAVEVEALVGADPQPAGRRKLALRAIAYATAADLEEGLFPEQQIGDGARAQYLRRRYGEVIALLEKLDGAGVATQSPTPRGSFPDPMPYPDPARGSQPCRW